MSGRRLLDFTRQTRNARRNRQAVGEAVRRVPDEENEARVAERTLSGTRYVDFTLRTRRSRVARNSGGEIQQRVTDEENQIDITESSSEGDEEEYFEVAPPVEAVLNVPEEEGEGDEIRENVGEEKTGHIYAKKFRSTQVGVSKKKRKAKKLKVIPEPRQQHED